MAETADDLSAPLGQNTARAKRRFRLPFTGMQALAVLLGLFLATFAGFVAVSGLSLSGYSSSKGSQGGGIYDPDVIGTALNTNTIILLCVWPGCARRRFLFRC